VGSYKPNPWGLYDMLGNVFDWVEDCYVEDYAQEPTDGSAAESANCKSRVLRGGAWYTVPRHMRSAYREIFDAQTPGYVGIRVVRAAAP
jgi:formylglycine-generating enzyme required for sulfatase activity